MFGWEFPPFNSGGLGVACLGLTRAMAAAGSDVVFVMPRKLDVRAPFATFVFADEAAGSTGRITPYAVDVLLSPYMTSKAYLRERERLGVGAAGYGADLFSEVARYASRAAAVAEQGSFDVIYAHDWLSFGAGVEAKRVSGKPLIVHVHATEFDRCGGAAGVNPYVYDVEKEGMEAADVVVAVSQLTKDIIVTHYGIPAEKIRVIYNGIDEATASAGGKGLARLHALKAAGHKIVLFLGRVTLQKGPDYFLRAAARAAAHDPNIMFVVAGSGDMEDAAMRLAADLGIADRVFFTGFLSGADKDEMYRAADLFVMPSVSEPFGIAPLEAMRVGTPVLISKQSGVSEVVQHALKADFWDVDDMANKMLAAVAHPALRETLAEYGTHDAEALTWQKAAAGVDGIIAELTAGAV
jgi:glycosyltransferase involved in cell wall biosynthesis